MKAFTKLACLGAASTLLALFGIFSLLEAFPSLLTTINLRGIPYYAQKARFVSHPLLGFTRRHESRVSKYVFDGDQYRKAYGDKYGIEPLRIPYEASFNADGFRANSSRAPFDVVVVGDSYVAVGETDDSTFSELLKGVSGLSTYNLGQSWYGPHQYNELLRQHAPMLGPTYIVYCFFDGNDIRDIEEYEQWRAGGDYHHFRLSRPYVQRFFSMLTDVWGTVGTAFREQQPSFTGLGRVRLQEREVWMKFGYWSAKATADTLLQRTEWRNLRIILTEFKALASTNGITPLLLFIPHKVGVYGELVSSGNEAEFMELVNRQLRFQDSSATALRRLASDVGVQFVDVTADFRLAAKRGELLYFPVDTHWNTQGRQEAARIVSDAIQATRH